MKESGIDWIGQIPQEWEMSKIRYLVTTRSEKRITDSSVPYIGLENIESQTGKFVKTGIQVDKSENIVVEIGDVLFGKLRPYLRKYWRATFTSTASSEFLVFQSSELDMNFLYYAIQSDSFIEEVNTSTYGSKMPRASWEYIKNMRIAFPTSLVEQQKLSVYPEKTILVVGIASIGKVGYSENHSYSNQQITALKVTGQTFPKYLAYLMFSSGQYIRETALYTIVPIINNQYLSSLKIVLPNRVVQETIVEYLDKKIEQINKMIVIKNDQIKNINKQRQTLIYDYVTGKRRV